MSGTCEKEEQKEKEKERSELNDYIPEPFPKHKFEPLRWNAVLATVTICVNDVTPTLFCDEDSFDVIPIQTVIAIRGPEENNPTQESFGDHTIEIELDHVKLDNEVSTFDLSFEHETQGETYYDASNELKEVDLHETQTKQGNPIIFKTQEGKEIELPQYPTPKQKQAWERKKKKLKKVQSTLEAPPTMQGK